MAILLSAILFLNACSSVQVKGKPFYENITPKSGDAGKLPYREFDAVLYEATEGLKKNTVTAQYVLQNIPGFPKITMTGTAEIWTYEYVESNDSLKLSFSGLDGKSLVREETLELTFDKNQILKSYVFKPDPFYASKTKSRSKWMFLALKGLLFGSLAGAAARVAFK